MTFDDALPKTQPIYTLYEERRNHWMKEYPLINGAESWVSARCKDGVWTLGCSACANARCPNAWGRFLQMMMITIAFCHSSSRAKVISVTMEIIINIFFSDHLHCYHPSPLCKA